ncbi:hypothetical protein BDV98DRAFT_601887 [Pterulicium gracile]|uniref:DUF6598 domain-containing protein n=1 Tax=Pterulicium gracile TaxID=1884261 RepID=A0A5C3QR15_9AGAR|nr:hypothetical protein BDV98DRAFT_601887 [Pterula gracilis]
MPTEYDEPFLPKGSRLFEILSVRIEHINKPDSFLSSESKVALYGTINARDDDGVEPIWTRSRQNPLLIRAGNTILLEGLSRPLYSQDRCNIELDLLVANGAEEELTFVNGFTLFDPRHGDKYGVAKRLFSGDLGSVQACYATFADALYASITIFPLDGDDDDSAVATNVYGTISATTRRGTSELFRQVSKHKSVTV